MPEMFSIGTSALAANQRLLSTASHNIANANTEGYTRQRVTLTQRMPQFNGSNYTGKGVDISGITRNASDYLTNNVRLSATAQSRASTFVDLATQVDSLLSDGSFAPTMQNFFTAVQDASNDPSSSSARTLMLNAANTLTDRFRDLNVRFNAMSQNVNEVLTVNVNKLNSLATSIAGLNRDIVQAQGLGVMGQPNDLLDKRDELLRQVSELVNVNVAPQFDGSVNVFVGNGQLLVAGEEAVKYAITPNALDGARREISIVNADGTRSEVSAAMSGGVIAGALQFRDEVLDAAQNGMGRLAVVMLQTLNDQHGAGQDLNGAMGTPLFQYGAPIVQRGTSGGMLDVQIEKTQLGALQASDYYVSVDAADGNGNFTLSLLRKSDGAEQTVTGTGPFNVDGMVISPSITTALGDRFLVQPTKYATRDTKVLIRDPLKLALGSPIRTSVATSNVGNGTVSKPTVLDSTAANLRTPTTIVFDDPPSSFRVNGGVSQPYTPGADIDANGWRVQIAGSPVAGDAFSIGPNNGARGDNTNGLSLLDLRTVELLDQGTATYQEAFSQVVGNAAARTQQATINRDSLKIQLESAQAARDQVAGVNLDEEAADLVRFQQAYQGAAQVIAAADTAFKALINAMQG